MRLRDAGVLLLAGLIFQAAGCARLAPEKRVRHPITTDYAVGEKEFVNSIGHLLGSSMVPSNSIVQLINGDRIFGSMLEAIRGARESVNLESYIWTSGKVSDQFVTALCQRAEAGVKVNLIADSLGSMKLNPADIARMEKAGARFFRYNGPQLLRPLGLNHRTHRKIMVVDGRIGFIGGVCLNDAWSGNAEPEHWRDTHLRVEGPVVAQIQAAFMDNWVQVSSEVLHGDDYFPALKPAGTITAQCFRSGPRDSAESARIAYLLAIAAARKNIRLAHSYFVPGPMEGDALIAALKRGVRVEVIVPQKIDHFAVASASRDHWGKLLEAGIKFYEYTPTLYHCKIMIVDDVFVTIGSINFDERSFAINDEANINVLDRGFAAEMIKTFEQDKTQSRVLTTRDMKKRNIFRRSIDKVISVFSPEL